MKSSSPQRCVFLFAGELQSAMTEVPPGFYHDSSVSISHVPKQGNVCWYCCKQSTVEVKSRVRHGLCPSSNKALWLLDGGRYLTVGEGMTCVSRVDFQESDGNGSAHSSRLTELGPSDRGWSLKCGLWAWDDLQNSNFRVSARWRPSRTLPGIHSTPKAKLMRWEFRRIRYFPTLSFIKIWHTLRNLYNP